MKIPQNPQIPSADVMEKFLNGEKPPDKPSKKNHHAADNANKKAVKMYNVPFPPEVHKQAKINALNEAWQYNSSYHRAENFKASWTINVTIN